MKEVKMERLLGYVCGALCKWSEGGGTQCEDCCLDILAAEVMDDE